MFGAGYHNGADVVIGDGDVKVFALDSAVIPGSAFGPGGEGFVRACYAASMKDIAESIARMDNFLTNLRRKQGRSEG